MGLFDWLRGRRPEPEPAPEPEIVVTPPPTADDITRALAQAEAMVATGVSPAISSRVHHITSTIRETLPRIDAVATDSLDKYSLMATATDYLPEALGAYLRLPRDWADSRPVDGRKTSLILLIDQLDLLGGTMDRILDAVARADATALIAHGRFLQQKFGAAGTGGSLDLGDAPVPPPPANPLDLEAPR